MRDFIAWSANKSREHGSKWDPSDLSMKFVKAFNTGERIRVKMYGEVMTGTVGVTTGWKPVFLLMRRSNAIGSSYLLTHEVSFTDEKIARKGN